MNPNPALHRALDETFKEAEGLAEELVRVEKVLGLLDEDGDGDE